tara:strand:- start:977 stop:1651 length:675 start_codon:yes stop_codon:yes gene_type:complete
MIPYASALPKKECLEILDKHFEGWRFLLSPASAPSVSKAREHLLYDYGYALDNGVYADWNKGRPFNEDRFLKLVEKWYHQADWIVIPDSVGNWTETLQMFQIWISRLMPYGRPLLMVAQDGCEENDFQTIRNIVNYKSEIGIFIGGSTEFKMEYGGSIARICREAQRLCHVGRVNSAKRVRICDRWGVNSFDGSGMSMFSETARVVSKEMKKIKEQPRLFGGKL